MPATIAAVKYACDGEAQKEFQIPVYKAYHLPHTHDIFQEGEVSELSRLIGMPLVLMRLRPSLLAVYRPRDGKHRYVNGGFRKDTYMKGPGLFGDEELFVGEVRKPVKPEREEDWTAYANYAKKDGANYFPNDTAAHLMVACSATQGAQLLHPPEEWMKKVGSVLIARQDMVPLHPMQIEILKAFINAIYENIIKKSQGQGITAAAVAEALTPALWQSYWTYATENMVAAGQGEMLEGVACPYNLEDTAEAEVEDGDEGGVQLGADFEMTDFSDEGFTQ